jgi:hypothetical protein
MASCECPRISITTRAGTLCASSRDAQVCRRWSASSGCAVGVLVLATKRALIRWTERVPQRLLSRSLVLTAAARWSMSAARRSDAHRKHYPEHLQAEANCGAGVSSDCRSADPWVVVHRNLDDSVPCN